MNPKIESIIVYKDTDLVEMIVTCKYCGGKNFHTIGHATTVKKDYKDVNCLVIDFAKLGNRACDNIKCNPGQYPLYLSS